MAAFSMSASAAADADAATKALKDNGCTKCHSVDKAGKGPAFRGRGVKGKADAEGKLTTFLTTGPKVKMDQAAQKAPRPSRIRPWSRTWCSSSWRSRALTVVSRPMRRRPCDPIGPSARSRCALNGIVRLKERNRVADPRHKVWNEARPPGFLIDHPFECILLQGMKIGTHRRTLRHRAGENVEQAIDGMQPTPQIVVFTRRDSRPPKAATPPSSTLVASGEVELTASSGLMRSTRISSIRPPPGTACSPQDEGGCPSGWYQIAGERRRAGSGARD